ncbi:MAG: hypothetical protein EHM55_25110 [Acidobacteria bacterium]|nr:MAG: hypothetical protein EHM55_25110 [Acidobacteriota bacterium]
MRRVAGLLLVGVALLSSTVAAQEQLAIRTDFLFYGDNTEFSNPFREGETIFGATVRVGAEVALNERVTLSAGGFANQRFGSEDAFEQARPVLALTVRGRRSSFVMGTLPPPTASMPVGPDQGGPHGLLPPLQRETLSFDRPYEAGLAWTFAGSRLQHHVWLEWQRLNTPEHRERFDGGLRASYRVADFLSLPLQVHVVHEGGQLHASGAVADSPALAAGAVFNGDVWNIQNAALELYALASRYVPDRDRPDLSRDGVGFFGRASAERAGWRGHVIFWRGRNFIKEEGDPNYLSIARSGDRYRGTRDYSEAGLTRRFTLAPAAVLDVSGRLHRVEGRYEYSYRIVSVVSALWRVR